MLRRAPPRWKPKLRASLENVAKRLAAKEKAKGAAAAGAAAEVVVEKCDEAAAAGHTSVVVEVPAGVDGKSVGKLAKKIHKAHPGLALFVVAGGGGKVGAFAAVPDGHALAPAGAWLNAALEPPAGGAAASRPSRRGRRRATTLRPWWRRRGRSPRKCPHQAAPSCCCPPGWWWCCHCALHERHPIFVRLSRRA